MRVLVTGGAGFIGSNTVDALVAAGHAVAVVDNLHGGKRENLNPAAAFHELDIRDPGLGEVFGAFRPTHVIHFAAQMDVRISLEQPVHDADVNVGGSIRVLQACVDHGVEKVVLISTAGAIYGEPEVLPASEAYPALPVCHYGQSKHCMELYGGLYQRVYGLRYTVLRYTNVYGPRQNPHGEAGVCAILTQLMLDGKTPTLYGHGAPVRDYVYVGDVVRANLLALERGDGETINIASSTGASVAELYAILQEHTGFTGEPVLKPLRAGEVMKIVCTRDRAAQVLGWAPETPLSEGLGAVVAHIRKQRGG
jgi:UDP-glucose 4-epimerase